MKNENETGRICMISVRLSEEEMEMLQRQVEIASQKQGRPVPTSSYIRQALKASDPSGKIQEAVRLLARIRTDLSFCRRMLERRNDEKAAGEVREMLIGTNEMLKRVREIMEDPSWQSQC